MTKHFSPLLFTFFLLITFSLNIIAGIPPKPFPNRLVNDYADILLPYQERELEYNLRLFHHNTSNQIVILTVTNLGDKTPSSYAYEVGEKWGVGQKDFNNGIVVLVIPKFSDTDKGQVFIAVGYGLEPAIPDATAKRIVENKMIPYFQNNDYYEGINKATISLMALASGEISVQRHHKKSKFLSLFLFFLPFVILLALMLLWIWGRKSPFSLGSKSSFWTNLWLLNSMGGSSHSGSWESFSSGSHGYGGGNFQVGGHFGGGGSFSSGGSGFSGGFSGFGGGSFGGGGAGGSW